MKYWLPFIWGLGSAPFWLRALLSERLQEKYDNFFNVLAMKKFAIALIALSFMWANYQTMKEQNGVIFELNKNNIELESEKKKLINKLDTTKPQLIGDIIFYDVGEIDQNLDNLLVLASIANSGTTSIVEGWSLSIKTPSNELVDILPHQFPQQINLYSDRRKHLFAILKPQDAIYEKALKPIISGDKIRGWLLFYIDRKQCDLKQPGIKVIIYFNDYLNQRYSASFITRGGKGEKPGYIPGIRNPFIR